MTVGGVAIFLGRQRPDASASLRASLPAPQTWTRVSSASTEETGPLTAEFRSLVLASPQAGAVSGNTSILALRVPVPTGDCAKLEGRLGGSCGQDAQPSTDSEIAIQSLDSPLQGSMALEGTGPFEMSQSGAGGAAQPSEWTLVEEAPKATLAFECRPGNRLLLAAGGKSAAATCARLGAEYELDVVVPHDQPPHLHLFGVHALEAEVHGKVVTAAVEEGQLVLDRETHPLAASEPQEFSIRSKTPHSVALEVRDLRSGATHISAHTDLASAAEGAGYMLPTRFEASPEIFWLVIGLFAGSFLTACFEYLLAGRRP